MRDREIIFDLVLEKTDTNDEFGLPRKFFNDVGDRRLAVYRKQRFIDDRGITTHPRSAPGGENAHLRYHATSYVQRRFFRLCD